MRFKITLTTAFTLLACHLLLLTTVAQEQPSKQAVSAKDVQALSDRLRLAANVDLDDVERLLEQISDMLAHSQRARERLYDGGGLPFDNTIDIRLNHLKWLSKALTKHAAKVGQSGDYERAYRALDLSLATMLLIASAPAPPAKVRIGLPGRYAYISGDEVAPMPVFALEGALGVFVRELRPLVNSPAPKWRSLSPVLTSAYATMRTVHEGVRRFREPLIRGEDKEVARRCAEIRREAAK